uniref:Uncharacterized protein n=1 Tax=Romanomermis culicivorax TaxID=13658 RepID=A0A915HMV5_ROMCU
MYKYAVPATLFPSNRDNLSPCEKIVNFSIEGHLLSKIRFFCLLRNEKTGFRRSSSFYDEHRSFLRALRTRIVTMSSIIFPLIMILFSTEAASIYVPTRIARRVTIVNAAARPATYGNTIINPCPATSSKARTVGGYNIGVGLMAVGTFYGRRYTQDDDGCRYEAGSIGTQGLGAWPRGVSMGAPINIKEERGGSYNEHTPR